MLSKEALRRLANEGDSRRTCRQDIGAEDVNIGQCMQNLGVKTMNTTDSRGRNRFLPLNFEQHMQGLVPDWMYRFSATDVRRVSVLYCFCSGWIEGVSVWVQIGPYLSQMGQVWPNISRNLTSR